ncbi:MAG: diaminopimelate epimerase [bacterium]
MKFRFRKYHGLGNDFVIVDRRKEQSSPDWLTPERIRFLCNRHLGIGADGILLLERGKKTVFRMILFNADGGRAEVSGNGLRCFLLFLRDIGEPISGPVQIETDAGISEAEIVGENRVKVQMPPPVFAPSNRESMLQRLEVANSFFDVVILSVGNPHCVIFGPARDEIFVRTYGPLIEKLPIFPAGTNVEFAHVMGNTSCQLAVWERGAGLTLACGSGAAATACAGVAPGKLRSGTPITLSQLGGDLQIIVQPDFSMVTLEGPAEFVFEGEIEVR